ncbi:hypothetical protein GCM10010411_13450 [Actinomadura fulvescens]|uniref:Uncharacterized protein n=1 Tax=Actinomadura fulvescens TaxID=46160 RepID=A0ABN3PEM2_9ACTN
MVSGGGGNAGRRCRLGDRGAGGQQEDRGGRTGQDRDQCAEKYKNHFAYCYVADGTITDREGESNGNVRVVGTNTFRLTITGEGISLRATTLTSSLRRSNTGPAST